LGVVLDTLRGWAKQARVDAGVTPGTELEREVKELRRQQDLVGPPTTSDAARLKDPRLPW